MLKKKGFTLIELLVVVAIVSLLAAIAVPRVIDRIRRARMVRAEADIRGIENALAMLTTDAGAPLLVLLNETHQVYLAIRNNASATPLVAGLLKSTLEYGPYPEPWWDVLKPGVYKNLSSSYMDKGIPEDPWGGEYNIFLAPPGRYARRDWAQLFFFSYRGEDQPWEAPATTMDYYIYSWGENRMSDQAQVFSTGARNGYDDVNNWDADRGWADAYR